MNNVWVASDWHLWTKNLNGRHPFVSTAKIDQLISNYTEVIQPTDIFIYLGDLCDLEVADIKKLQAFISSIPGYKILCKGDHDTEIPEFYLNLGFNDVCDICKIHSIIFSHMPVKVAPDMINIHGDSHSRKQSNLGYQHICVYDEDGTMCPKLVDDLLQNPPNTNPEKYGASTEDQEQNIFRTYHGDALADIIDISSKVDLYPMDEVAAHSNVYAAMDLNELQTPQDLYDWMRKNIHYGNYTKLKTDVQLLKSHSGSCHDQVYFAYPRLRQMGVNPKILFFVEYKEGQSKGGMTHTLIYWKDEHSDKVIWFENAWNGQQGIHEFDSFDSLKKYIEDEHDRMPSSKNFPNLYFKTVPFNRFKAGMTLQELVKAIMEGDELDESTEIVYGDIILESISGDGFKSGEMSPEFAMLVETARMEVENDPIDEIIFDDIEDTKHWLADDDVEDRKKPDAEVTAIDESWFLAKDDLEINMKQWKPGNPLWIAGSSGDGKSTKAQELANKHNAIVVTSDIVLCRMGWSKEKFDQILHGNTGSAESTFKMNFGDSPAIDYVLDHPELPYNAKDPVTRCMKSEITIPEMIKFFMWFMKESAVNPKYKNKLYIIEGCDICLLDPKLMSTKPLIIMGGSRVQSLLRRVRREVNSGDLTYIEALFKYIKKYDVQNRRLDDNKDLFRNNVDSLLEESTDTNIKFINDKGEEVPKVCPDCGSKVGVFLQGEPVFLCTNKKCKKYFGTVPCNLDESVRELAKAGKAVSIYRIHTVSANDELEPAGAPFANTVAGAVENYRRENWKTKEPPAEAYVHMPEIGYYDFHQSDEYWNSWWSTNDINLKMIGKIKINDDWSWEWIERYNDDGTVVNLNEAATENKPEKYKSLNSFKHKVCDEGELVHWKEKFPEELSRLDPDVNTTVTLWMTKDESKMVAYIALEKNGNQTIMQTLGVFPEYRSYGLDKQLMKYAKINGATLLYVNPSNKTAVNLYKSCGWKYAGWKNRGMVQPMVLDEAATKTDSGLKVTTKNTTNPNDSVSTKAVALNFYDGKDHIGEVYISAVDTKEGFIYNLEVFKKYRGKGYGRKIMEYVLDNYDATDLTVDPDNEIAIKLYKSLGFKFKKKIKDPTDGAEVLWFHRNLTRSVNEDAAQLQGYDRKQQEDVSKKYGIKAVGHDTPDDTPEKRVDQRREKQLKNLKKARKVKKRKAFVRKIKTKLPGNHNKKNEDVDISDIPVNQGEKNFFDRSVAAFDFENETGYKFAMAENIKFIDAVNESASADNKLYPVYIMLMHSGTALATAIKTITQSHFSHSSISFDSSMKSMYSFGRKMDTNPFIGSFKKENIHDDFFKGKSIPYALYVVPCTKDEIGLMKKRLDYFIKNATKFHYDFTGLFKNYLGIADNPEYKWFCSRFVADILNAGRPSSDPYVVEPSLMKPEDFLYTNFAIYVTGGLLDAYDQDRVDAITRRILRVEEIKRRKEKQIVQNEAVDIFDLDPFDPLQEAVLSYHLSALSENALGDFMNYLKSFKVRFDKNGNVIITRREYDQLDKHFRQSIRMLKAYEKANDVESVKEELCKIYYMIGLINQHYLNPANKQNKTVKSDIRKEMMDLRSVMMNVFQQHLTYVTNQDPKFNFQQYYNQSKYSSTVEIPNTVISAVGKALVTGLK